MQNTFSDKFSDIQQKIQAGQFEAALSELALLSLSGDEQINQLLLQAVCHRGLNQRQEALAKLKTLLEKDPTNIGQGQS